MKNRGLTMWGQTLDGTTGKFALYVDGMEDRTSGNVADKAADFLKSVLSAV